MLNSTNIHNVDSFTLISMPVVCLPAFIVSPFSVCKRSNHGRMPPQSSVPPLRWLAVLNVSPQYRLQIRNKPTSEIERARARGRSSICARARFAPELPEHIQTPRSRAQQEKEKLMPPGSRARQRQGSHAGSLESPVPRHQERKGS